MKKLLLLLALILPFGSFAQNGRTEVLTSPNQNSPHFLIDTVFTLGSILQDTTVVYLHYHNPTAVSYAGFQVRFFYPTAAFKQPIVKWGPTATGINTKYGSYYSQPGWVNATAIYTGTSAVFDWPDGAVFEVLLPHAVGFNPSAVDSLEVQSAPAYTNIATTIGGIDMTTQLQQGVGDGMRSVNVTAFP